MRIVNILNILIILRSHALLSVFLASFVIQAIDHALESRLSKSSIFLYAMLLRKRRDTLPKDITQIIIIVPSKNHCVADQISAEKCVYFIFSYFSSIQSS